MHTPIHPKAYAISDVCHAVLRKLDLIDDVSPELGKRVNIRGCLLFRRSLPTTEGNPLKVYNLADFIEASFTHFATFPAELQQISKSKPKISRAIQFIHDQVHKDFNDAGIHRPKPMLAKTFARPRTQWPSR
ncbi:hypothetical protein [Roseomonas sp. 18066]|uniref:hypothetical protein n=1 Tax=Roseomonas sp. 18066 TaxID=2681412 RepID=UPI00135972F9|nr:hypothetical protein [Roseomonas sp. 18066]